ncbi:hypothetical protein ACYJ1Y_05470 [Natrialbaceae archaeon A-gly3]
MSDDDTDDVEIEIETEPGASGTDDRGRSTSDVVDEEGRPIDRPLEDELGRIDIRTTPEGYVEGRVTDLWSVDETTVGLEITLPHGETATFTLEKPIPWSETFLLARIVEDVGYDAASIDHLVGETVCVARTDAGPTAEEGGEDWWISTLETTGNAVLTALGGQYRLEEEASPEWRLVDPLERAPDEEDGLSAETLEAVSSLLIVLGTIIAVAGALAGATGTLAVSSTALSYALPGLVVVLIGLYALTSREEQ